MKTILLAFQAESIGQVLEAFKNTQYKLVPIVSIDEALPSYAIDVAFIDESFSGKDSGLKLASRIRNIQKMTKIVVLVREKDLQKYSNPELQKHHDWIMLYETVSAEQILDEIERPWSPQ